MCHLVKLKRPRPPPRCDVTLWFSKKYPFLFEKAGQKNKNMVKNLEKMSRDTLPDALPPPCGI